MSKYSGKSIARSFDRAHCSIAQANIARTAGLDRATIFEALDDAARARREWRSMILHNRTDDTRYQYLGRNAKGNREWRVSSSSLSFKMTEVKV